MAELKVVRLSEHSNDIQVTPVQSLEMAIEECRSYGDVIETIVFMRRESGHVSWIQGGGQSSERVLWNITSLVETFKKNEFSGGY